MIKFEVKWKNYCGVLLLMVIVVCTVACSLEEKQTSKETIEGSSLELASAEHLETAGRTDNEDGLRQNESMEIELFEESTFKRDPMILDFNNDGMIGKDEAIGPMKDVFDQLDLDKNEFITEEELDLVVELRSGVSTITYNNEEYTAFTLLDIDRDGLLTYDEMHMLTKEEFDYLDEDSDGFIREEELSSRLNDESL